MLDRALWNATFLVRRDDLLLSRANTVDLVGLVCHVRSCPRNLMLSDKTLRLRVDTSKIIIRFIFFALQLPSTRRQIQSMATGTSGSMKNISQANVKALMIRRAPEQEQHRIAERIDSLEESELALHREVLKNRALKRGLMQDLLTGRVPVAVETAYEPNEVAANV